MEANSHNSVGFGRQSWMCRSGKSGALRNKATIKRAHPFISAGYFISQGHKADYLDCWHCIGMAKTTIIHSLTLLSWRTCSHFHSLIFCALSSPLSTLPCLHAILMAYMHLFFIHSFSLPSLTIFFNKKDPKGLLSAIPKLIYCVSTRQTLGPECYKTGVPASKTHRSSLNDLIFTSSS